MIPAHAVWISHCLCCWPSIPGTPEPSVCQEQPRCPHWDCHQCHCHLWVCAVGAAHPGNQGNEGLSVSCGAAVRVWLQVFTPAWGSVEAAGELSQPLQGLLSLLSTGSTFQLSQLGAAFPSDLTMGKEGTLLLDFTVMPPLPSLCSWTHSLK